MKAVINEDIIRQGITWIEAGEYPVLREFDSTRMLVELMQPSKFNQHKRQLTIISKEDLFLERAGEDANKG
jgi:hypothetical protein